MFWVKIEMFDWFRNQCLIWLNFSWVRVRYVPMEWTKNKSPLVVAPLNCSICHVHTGAEGPPDELGTTGTTALAFHTHGVCLSISFCVALIWVGVIISEWHRVGGMLWVYKSHLVSLWQWWWHYRYWFREHVFVSHIICANNQQTLDMISSAPNQRQTVRERARII